MHTRACSKIFAPSKLSSLMDARLGQASRGRGSRVCFRLLLTEGLRRKGIDALAPSIGWFTLLRYAFYKTLLIFVTTTVASGGRSSNTLYFPVPSSFALCQGRSRSLFGHFEGSCFFSLITPTVFCLAQRRHVKLPRVAH